MPRKTAWPATIALAALGIALSLPTGADATCYGLRYDYYESSAMQTIVGSKVSCPGYPDQYDEDVNGNYTVTPWYTVEQTICPCPSGGGGGNGGGNDQDEEAP
ncbi:MAG: hypothetical protein KDD11_14300 [Acidobacteria bacterium]|nr:hypothetical protein [Acidobacteriota bacterium]